MINEQKLDLYRAAIYEAHRFIEKAEVAVKRLRDDKFADFGCKETGAAKRSSMDLSRALADIRK